MIDNVPTVAEFNARTLTSASYATAAELATKPTAAEVWTNGTRSLTDKEGFSLTQTFPPNFAAFDLDASGRVNIGEILDTPQTSGFDLWLITEQLPKVLLDTTVASVTSQTVFVVNNGWGSANLGATYLAGQLVIFRNASLGQNYEPSVRRVVSFDNVTKTLTIDSACSFTVGVEDEVRILPDKDVAGGGGLTSQETRDAMKLAPTAGAAASGSIDKKLDTAITR
jgi:hypothetical protein